LQEYSCRAQACLQFTTSQEYRRGKKSRRIVVKKILFAVTLIAIFSMAAMGQSPSLTASTHQGAAHVGSNQKTPIPGPPPICHPCLFYGGDVNVNDPNAQSFADGNTLLVPDTETLGAVVVPAGKQVVVEGLLANLSPTLTGNVFDPETATWEIRTGLSDGNGGTQVASGSGTINPTLTGRDPFGLTEYTVAVAVVPPVTLPAGTYWVNVSPQCTDSSNANCSSLQYFVSNTTQETNSVRGALQPLHEVFLNSAFFGFTYANWCDPALGQTSEQCAAMSFGAIGTHN
jgi:hypothetical protein